MANSDKDILITPNSGSSSADPKIEYVGADSSGNDTITVETLYDGTKSTLSFEGSAGQLFSIVNDLTSDPIFSVNDVSGIPSIEVDSDGEIRLAEFSGNVGIGISSPTELLHVDGTIKANNLTLASLSAQNSEATAVMIDGSGIIGTRELGSNAFNSTAFLTSSSLSGYATESYVNTQVSNLVDSAPGTLDTLNELAAALGDDANFSTTVTNSIATKAPIASPSFTTKITTPQIHHTGAISVLNGSAAQGMKVGSLYVGTSYSNSAASGQVNTLNGYRVQGTEVINSSGNWVGGGNISEFTNNSGYITGNQTITLSGDVSGSGTTSISVTIADDSHNHVISNVDGLQTALDAKLASSSYTAADVLTKIKTVDGSGSGLDADTLDGLQLHTGTNNVANRVVRTDGNGYIQAGWINTISGATSSTLTRIYCSQDGYIRYQTPANFGVSISPHINYNTIANTPTLGGGTPYLDLATGDYGTVKVDDDRGITWAGYAIRDDWVFMSNGADTSGIYNDTDNDWAALFKRNAEVELYHNGALKMETTSSGISVTGNVVATGNVTAYSSDERLKTNITPIKNPIEKVKQLNGVEFDWKDNVEELGFTPRVKHETGVIAQNVQSVIPDATPNAPFNEEYLTVQHEKIIPVLIEAIKEQQKQIDELKQALHEQKEIK